MIIRPITLEEKNIYNRTVTHPLQSWEWGEFKKLNGQKVERVGFFEGNKLVTAMQVTFHLLPGSSKTIGYLPKGPMPDEEQIMALRQLADKHKAVFIKIEPDVMIKVGSKNSGYEAIEEFINQRGGRRGKTIFTPYTFLLNLQTDEENLLAQLHSKTRYNVRLAKKKGVKIIDDTSDNGLETFIKLLDETTFRQNFYAHDAQYYRQMWQVMKNTNYIKIFHAVYQETVLVSWILFTFNKRLYYPYGASSNLHREVMASNLMMWEVIKFGKEHQMQDFDMWGALGPEAKTNNPWYGFHRFKEGYGGNLMVNFPAYDFIYQPQSYRLFNLTDKLRWSWLKSKKILTRIT